MLLLALAVIGGIVLLVTGGGGSSSSSSSKSISDLENRYLKQTVVNPDRGIEVRRPQNWTDSKSNGAISLQSHGRCLAMTLSAPVPAGQVKSLRSDSIALLRRSYKNTKVASGPNAQVGGIPTTSYVLSLTDQKGRQVRALLSVGAGKKYAYLTEIVVRSAGCQSDLQLANLVLRSIQYTK